MNSQPVVSVNVSTGCSFLSCSFWADEVKLPVATEHPAVQEEPRARSPAGPEKERRPPQKEANYSRNTNTQIQTC